MSDSRPAGGHTTQASHSLPFQPGDVLAGRYRIKRYVAQGAVGVIFEARDMELGVDVAIKALRSELADRPATVKRFRREVQLARRVTHPNVCRIFDLGRHRLPDGGQVIFLSMELLRGGTLADWIRSHAPATGEVILPILRQLVNAIETAHAAGVIHRDFKPGNVVLDQPEDGNLRAVVTDFGLSRSLETVGDDSHPHLTRTGHLVGTPAYVAPEQLRGETPSNSTDVYALGVVLYEMLTAKLPFEGENPLAMAFNRLRELPTPPERHRPDLDPGWSRAVLRCLERDRSRRYGSARLLLDDLEGATRQDEAPRRRGRLAAAALATAAAAVLVTVLVRSPAPIPELPDEASQTSPAAISRRTVLVLPLTDRARTTGDSWLGDGFAEMLRTELSGGGLFLSVSGEEVRRVLRDLGLELDGTAELTDDDLERVARRAGHPLLVTGALLPPPADDPQRLDLDLQIFDLQLGEAESRSFGGRATEPQALAAQVAEHLRQRFARTSLSGNERDRLRAAQPPGAAAGLYNRGLERLREGDAALARSILEQAVAAAPEFPLAHAALSQAWSQLGYDERAAASAQTAFELSKDLPREQQFTVEARYRASRREHDRLEEIYRTLHNYHPDNDDYALRMVEALQLRGLAPEALAAIEGFKEQIDDPRLLILETRSARQISELDRALAIAQQAEARARALGARSLLAEALLEVGLAELMLGRITTARERFEASLELADELGDRSATAAAQTALAHALDAQGDLAEARAAYELPLATYREIADARGRISIYSRLANNAQRRRAFDEAEQWIEQGIRLAEEVADPYARNDLLNVRGVLLWSQHKLSESERVLRQALAEERRLGRLVSRGSVSNNLGITLYDLARFDDAIDAYQEALATHRQTGYRQGEADVLNNLGTALWMEGNLPAAQDHLETAIKIYRAIGSSQGERLVLFNLAELSYERGLTDQAIERFERLIELLVESRQQSEVPSTEIALALAEVAAGRAEQAHQRALEAARRLEQANDPECVWAYAVVAKSLLALERPRDALAALEHADELRSSEAELDQAVSLSVRIIYQRASARVRDAGHAAGALDEIAAEASQLGYRRQEILALIARGEAERLDGRDDEARQTLGRAASAAEALGFGLYARDARTLLAAPVSSPGAPMEEG